MSVGIPLSERLCRGLCSMIFPHFPHFHRTPGEQDGLVSGDAPPAFHPSRREHSWPLTPAPPPVTINCRVRGFGKAAFRKHPHALWRVASYRRALWTLSFPTLTITIAASNTARCRRFPRRPSGRAAPCTNFRQSPLPGPDTISTALYAPARSARPLPAQAPPRRHAAARAPGPRSPVLITAPNWHASPTPIPLPRCVPE